MNVIFATLINKYLIYHSVIDYISISKTDVVKKIIIFLGKI